MERTAIETYVDYLAEFSGHTAASKNMFDEYIKDSPYDKELKIETYAEKTVLKILSNEQWKGTILLSGNAGDGKSRLCRSIQEKLGYTGQNEFRLEDGRQVVIISDVSEYTESKTFDILNRCFENERIYLVCANEGRVRSVLKNWDLNDRRRQIIDEQMKNGPDLNSSEMIVFNLNLFPTSSYVPELLNKVLGSGAWETCSTCPAKNSCPIYFNYNKLRHPLVIERLLILYQIIENTGNHITMRELISHLIYTLLGDKTCRFVFDVYQKSEQEHGFLVEEKAQAEMKESAYFRNVWGDSLSPDMIERNTAFRVLQNIQVKDISCFYVDNFIIQGDITEDKALRKEYNHLFRPSLDLGGREFHYNRAYYLNTGPLLLEDETDNEHFINEWLVQMRRKVFFEWEKAPIQNMIPFRSYYEYEKLINEEVSSEEAAKQIVLALNRVFTGLFLSEKEKLLLTAHFYGGAEQQIPIIEHEVPSQYLDLEVSENNVMGQTIKKLVLTHAIFPDESPRLDIDLLVFEYLYRLSLGGSRTELSQLCELRVLKFKEEMMAFLPKTMRSKNKKPSGIKVIFRNGNGNYQVKNLLVDEGVIKIGS